MLPMKRGFMKLTKLLLLYLCSAILSSCQTNEVTTIELTAEETAMTTTATPETTHTETTELVTTEAETVDTPPAPQLPDVGSWDGNTYHNEFAQLTFNLPNEWETFQIEDIPREIGFTEEQIKQINAQSSSSFVMFSRKPSNYAAVTLGFENLNMVFRGSKITIENYADNLKFTVSQAHDYKFEDLYEKEIGGNVYTVLECNLPEYGLALHYYLRKVDNIIICLSINGTPNDSTEEIIEYFD